MGVCRYDDHRDEGHAERKRACGREKGHFISHVGTFDLVFGRLAGSIHRLVSGLTDVRDDGAHDYVVGTRADLPACRR